MLKKTEIETKKDRRKLMKVEKIEKEERKNAGRRSSQNIIRLSKKC